jgi:repressor LexA
MKNTLTDKQQNILEYISRAMEERGFPPSLREISSHFGIQSTQGVLRHLDALEKKGYLKRDAKTARSLQLTSRMSPEDSYGFAMIPVLGQVAAGVPIAAIENAEEHVPISKDWMSMGKDYFLLKVKGDSMAEAIQPGDLVLVEKQTRPERGQIVVAMWDEEATVKRFYREESKVILRSDNPSYQDIVLPSTTVLDIVGKVTGLIRKY